MARYAERDEYEVGSLVGGLPTATFRPKTYSRVIIGIEVGNSVPSVVNCYRGLLGSTPVAHNSVGDNNTLKGDIRLPAGQTFFVQWDTVGASASQAFARVSFERDDSPLEGGFVSPEWSTNVGPQENMALANALHHSAAATSVGGAEAAVASATWDQEPDFTFFPGELFKVTVSGHANSSAGDQRAIVRVRLGQESTTGLLLLFWYNGIPSVLGGNNISFTYTGYIKNSSAGVVTTKLSLTVQRIAGAGNYQIRGDVTGGPLMLEVEDLGRIVDHPEIAAAAISVA